MRYYYLFTLLIFASTLKSQHEEIYNKYVDLNAGVSTEENQLKEDFRNLNGKIKSLILYQFVSKEEKYEGGYLGSHGYLLDEQGKIQEKWYFYEENVPVMKVYFNDYSKGSWSKKVIFNKDSSELYQRTINYNDEDILVAYNNFSEGKKKDKGKFKVKGQKDSVVVRQGSIASKYFQGKLLERNYHVLSTKLITASEKYAHHDNGGLSSIKEYKKKQITRHEKYDDEGRIIEQYFDLGAANGDLHDRLSIYYIEKIELQLGEINLHQIVDDRPSSYLKNSFVDHRKLNLGISNFGTVKTNYSYNAKGLVSKTTFNLSQSQGIDAQLDYTYEDVILKSIDFIKAESKIWNRTIFYNEEGDITSITGSSMSSPFRQIEYLGYDDQGNWIKRRVTDQNGKVSIYKRLIEYYN